MKRLAAPGGKPALDRRHVDRGLAHVASLTILAAATGRPSTYLIEAQVVVMPGIQQRVKFPDQLPKFVGLHKHLLGTGIGTRQTLCLGSLWNG